MRPFWFAPPANHKRQTTALHFLRNRNRVAVLIFEGEFFHAVELFGNGHRDLRACFLYAVENTRKLSTSM